MFIVSLYCGMSYVVSIWKGYLDFYSSGSRFKQAAKSIDFICRQISYEPQTKEYHFIKGTNCYMLKFLSFFSLQICALQSDFAINAAENCSPLVPVQQQGQIYRKLLLAAWRDKAGHIKTSSLACGTVQPAWITLLYT